MVILALQHSTPWCCDCHENSNFHLSYFFLGDPDHLRIIFQPAGPVGVKRKRKHLRTKADRQPLHEKLVAWRSEAHACHENQLVYPLTWICDDQGLELLSKTHPDDLQSTQNIIELLDETEEWGCEFAEQVLDIIQQFNQSQAGRSGLECPMKRINIIPFMPIQNVDSM